MNDLHRSKKVWFTALAFAVITLIGLPACIGMPNTVTVTAPVTKMVVVDNPFTPPTVKELADKHFTYPEMQRITGDKLWDMISEANANGETQSRGTYIVYNNFQIIDVRNGVLFKKPGRIAGAVNFPLSYYWVLDPQQDPKQEEVISYTQELQQLEDNLPTLNRDIPLIFYDETSNDQAACMVVRLFQELNAANNWGFDPNNMWILYGGFYHFTLDLGHPWVYGDAQDAEGPGGYNPPPAGNIGLSVGGAKDVNNFRENIRNDYLPVPTDITYEGLFYDYYFDTGANAPADKLFSPSYSFAVSRDPFSGRPDYYLSVGLNSGIKQNDFERKKLNLVILLDISGSMGESYNRYYYDAQGNRLDGWAEDGGSHRKIDSAKQAVIDILNQLGQGDRVAVVVFDTHAAILCGMRSITSASMRSTTASVTGLEPQGSTNLDEGLDLATTQFQGLLQASSYEYENRIIVLTDAMPNTGDYSATGLMSTVERNSRSRVYTTFIGIGVDFNSGLVESLTKIRGANYYSVHSGREFSRRVQEEFDFMVTPLVFDLELSFAGKGWQIEQVFGSPEADRATGSLVYINTLFPSKSEHGGNKGGLVLLKLKKTSLIPDSAVTLKVSYEDRSGKKDYAEARVALEQNGPEYFDNTGIRKGVLLSRYAALLKDWANDEKAHLRSIQTWEACINEQTGIFIPGEAGLSRWERQSLPLIVSPPYKRIFASFAVYFEADMNAIGDDTLCQELRILETLSRYR